MILELTGLPGVGKTTCQAYILQALRKYGFDVILRSEMKKLYIQNQFCANYPLNCQYRHLYTLIYLGRVCFAHLRDRYAIKKLFGAISKPSRLSCYWLSEDIILGEYYQNSFEPSKNGKTIYFSSEGIIHHSIAVKVWEGKCYLAFSKRWTDHYSSDQIIIIHLRANVETVLERLWTRGIPSSWPRNTILNKSSAREALFCFEESISECLSIYQTAGVKVYTLDLPCELNLLEAEVSKFMASLPF